MTAPTPEPGTTGPAQRAPQAPVHHGEEASVGTLVSRQVEAQRVTENSSQEQQKLQEAITQAKVARKQFASESVEKAEQAQQDTVDTFEQMGAKNFPPRVQEIHAIEQVLIQQQVLDVGIRSEAIAAAVILQPGDAQQILQSFGISTEYFDELVRAAEVAYALDSTEPVSPEALHLAAERVVFITLMHNEWSTEGTESTSSAMLTTATESLADDVDKMPEQEDPQEAAQEAQDVETQVQSILSSGDDEAVKQAITSQLGEEAYSAYEEDMEEFKKISSDPAALEQHKQDALKRVADAVRVNKQREQSTMERAIKQTEEILNAADEGERTDKINKALDDEHGYEKFQEEVQNMLTAWKDPDQDPYKGQQLTDEARLRKAQEVVLRGMINLKLQELQEAKNESFENSRADVLQQMLFMEMEMAHQDIPMVELLSRMGYDTNLMRERTERLHALNARYKDSPAEELMRELETRKDARDQRLQLAKEGKQKVIDEGRKIAMKEEPLLFGKILFTATTLARMREIQRLSKLDPTAPEDSDGFKEYKKQLDEYNKHKTDITELETQMKGMDKKSSEYKAAQAKRAALKGQIELWEEAEKIRTGSERARQTFDKKITETETKYKALKGRLEMTLRARQIALPNEFLEYMDELPNNPDAMKRASVLSSKTLGELAWSFTKKRGKDSMNVFMILMMAMFGEAVGEMETMSSQR